MSPMPPLGIHLEGVVKAFGDQLALQGIDLEIPQGSYVAVMGPNGAGKTTLLKVIAGLAIPTAGSVRVAGVEMHRAGPALRSLVGFVSHRSMLYGDLTARENLVFAAKLFGVPEPEAAAERSAELLSAAAYLDRPVRSLSRGMCQRVAVARALVHGPSVILLDEPFTGLDEVAASSLSDLLEDLSTPDRVLLVTLHDIARALSGPRRLIGMADARLVLDRPIDGERDEVATSYRALLGSGVAR